MQIDCLMRVLGKPELSNAIKLVDLETLMSNFGPPSPRMDDDQQQHPGANQYQDNSNYVIDEDGENDLDESDQPQ